MKLRLPFGTITIVHSDEGTLIIDGKQRTTTIVEFMCDEFADDDGLKFSDWSTTDSARASQSLIAVQEVELEEGEGLSDIVELFRRINTQSKQLSSGQLLKSCVTEPTIAFMMKVFYKPIEDDDLRVHIANLRDRWANVFCKSGYSIKPGGKSRTDFTFFASMVISLITGNSSAITSSFPLLFANGLKEEVTREMMDGFFTKMNTLMDIAEQGILTGYFSRLPKGYPKLGEISPVLYLINIHHSDINDPRRQQNDALVENNLQDFFTALNDDNVKKDSWIMRLRKNRTVKNLVEDLKFIRGESALMDEEADYDSAEE